MAERTYAATDTSSRAFVLGRTSVRANQYAIQAKIQIGDVARMRPYGIGTASFCFVMAGIENKYNAYKFWLNKCLSDGLRLIR